jgi:hypothetical protein
MSSNSDSTSEATPGRKPEARAPSSDHCADMVCPVCGSRLVTEKCKVVCRSERCRYRIVFNCAEF